MECSRKNEPNRKKRDYAPRDKGGPNHQRGGDRYNDKRVTNDAPSAGWREFDQEAHLAKVKLMKEAAE